MILFVNAAFREGSRTARLARRYLENCSENITMIDLGRGEIRPLNRDTLKIYNDAVAQANYDGDLFRTAKQFASAEKIVIAAPFWNFSIPSVLHDYLEQACTQGVTFDISADGTYYSLCKAKKLVYITTAGGYIPEDDHAFGYIRDLCRVFWQINQVEYYKADGLDIVTNNPEDILQETLKQMDSNFAERRKP